MKTAEEILKYYTGHAHGLMSNSVLGAMKAYAMQECEKVRQDCADNAKTLYDCPNFNCKGESIDKQSILSTPITLT